MHDEAAISAGKHLGLIRLQTRQVYLPVLWISGVLNPFLGSWHLRVFCLTVLHTWQIHASHLLTAGLADGTVLPCAAALFMIRLQARQVGACASPGCKQKRVL